MPQILQQRLCTVVTGTNGHPVRGENLTDVMGVYTIHRKGNDAGMLLCLVRTQHMHPGHILNALQSPSNQGNLPLVHPLEAHLLRIINGRMKAYCTGSVAGAGFELVGQFRIGGTLTGDGFNHFAAGQEGRHFLQQLISTVQCTNAHRAVHLVTGEGQKISPQCLHIHRHVRGALSSVHHHNGTYPMGKVCNLTDGIDPTQYIGYMGHGNDLRPGRDQLFHLVQVNAAVHFAFNEAEHGAGLAAYHLPGQQIAVVLHDGDQHLIPCLHMAQAVAVGHQIDAFRGVPGEDDFFLPLGVQEAADSLPSLLISFRSGNAQGIQSPKRVGVCFFVKILFCVKHALGTLGSGSIVQIGNVCAHEEREIPAIKGHALPPHTVHSG